MTATGARVARFGPSRGLATAGVLAMLTVGTVSVTWVSPQAAAVLAVVLAAAMMFAAVQWPRAMLVVAGLVPLADPFTFTNVLAPGAVPAAQFVSEGVLLIVGSVIAVRAVRAGRIGPAFDHPATPWLLAFAAVAGASAVMNAVPPVVAIAGLIFTIEAIAFFYLARMVGYSLPQASRGIAVLVAVVAGIAASAVLQALLAPNILWFQAFSGSFGEGGRVTGFFGNPNSLGAMIGLALPPAVFAITALRGRWRALAAGAAFLMLVALLLSFSRGAWVGVLVALPLVAILVEKRVLLVAAALGAASLLTASVMPRNLLVTPDAPPPVIEGEPADEGGFIFVGTTIDRVGAVGNSEDLRLRFLLEGLPIVADRPVLGVGPGRYGGAAASIFESPVYDEYGTSLYGFHTVHDFWLHMLGEVGVLGTLLFAGFLGTIVWRGLVAARRSDGLERALLAGCLAGTLAVSVNSLTEMLLEGNSTAFPFWLVLALGAAVADRRLEDRGSELPADHRLNQRPGQDLEVQPE